MTAPLDLDAYFARIGYAGPREPTLAVLTALHRLHPAAIPFENLSPLMGAPVPLELADLQTKLVAGGRGGYCYEHNGLLKAVLTALGFEVTGLAGRVRWGMAEDAPLRFRSHMTLLVTLPEGPFIADVGFGGMVMTGPLRLEPDVAQETPLERYRLASRPDGELDLQAELAPGDWRTLYRFDRVPHLDVDYAPLNWFTATHPASVFTTGLMVARAQPHQRLTLSNTRFVSRPKDGPASECTLTSIDEVAQVLTGDFGLTLPSGFAAIAPKLGLQ
jgi:N-hydroxyarylamine O-acetyltransferase